MSDHSDASWNRFSEIGRLNHTCFLKMTLSQRVPVLFLFISQIPAQPYKIFSLVLYLRPEPVVVCNLVRQLLFSILCIYKRLVDKSS